MTTALLRGLKVLHLAYDLASLDAERAVGCGQAVARAAEAAQGRQIRGRFAAGRDRGTFDDWRSKPPMSGSGI